MCGGATTSGPSLTYLPQPVTRRRFMPDDDRRHAVELHQYAQALGTTGHHREALVVAEEALALGARCFAKDEPGYAAFLLMVANEHYELRRLDEARTEAAQAVEILRGSPKSE